MKTESQFPEQIDDLLFFEDSDINNESIITKYQEQLKSGHYTQASNILKNSDAFCYGSDLFNLFENRIYNLQNYIKKTVKINPHIFSKDKPENAVTGTMWIG